MKISLGIELTKIMVLQYSNQETSVTIGESVRDEDGMWCILCGDGSYIGKKAYFADLRI